MSNPYTQVAWTYYRHFRAAGRRWALIGIVIVFLFLSILAACQSDMAMPMTLGLVFPIMCLTWHIREQFLDANVHLIPNYRRVHATVAVAAVLIATVLYPLLLVLFSRTHSVSMVSCFTITFGITIWFCFGKLLQAFIFPIFIIAVITEPGSILIKDYFSGKHEPLAYGLALFGLASSFSGLFKLFRITADDPDYSRLQAIRFFNADKNRQNPYAIPWFGKGWANWSADRNIARLSAHARRASTSAWSRIFRWQPGISVSLLMVMCGMAGIMWIPTYFTSREKPTLFVLGFFVQVISFMVFGLIQQSHRPSREILLPVDRTSYFRQVGINVALGFFASSAVIWVFSLLGYALIYQVSIPLDMIIYLTLISAFTQCLSFGIIVWVARLASKLYLSALFIPFYLQLGLMAAASETKSINIGPWMVLIAAVAAAVGLLITYDAYRRWLVADLD